MDRAGNAAIDWNSYGDPDSSAWAALRPAGGSFSTPVPLASVSGDRHLTGLVDPTPPILTPRQFRDRLPKAGGA